MQVAAISIVRKLTLFVRERRDIDAQQRKLRFIGLIAFGACAPTLGIADVQSASNWHATADIAAVAEAFLQRRLGKSHADTTVRAGMLDGRLKLTRCDQPLGAFLRPGAKIGPKTIVGIRCSGSKPWKMYVPVEVVVRAAVWVASQPLPKGHLLTQQDLTEDVRDVSRMTTGYISDPHHLLGQRLRSSVLAGRALTLKLIEANNIVARGQTVTLAVTSGGINIRMTGKALMDGALNQRIRVENLMSGRIVEGIVRSGELVEVLVPGALNRRSQSADVATPIYSHLHPKVLAPMVDTPSSNNDR